MSKTGQYLSSTWVQMNTCFRVLYIYVRSYTIKPISMKLWFQKVSLEIRGGFEVQMIEGGTEK